MVVHKPPMGWNTWNTFGEEINEEIIKKTADVLVDTGLAECGYNYLVIDDCWALKSRNEEGRLVPDPAKFPNGMKAVSDYVHSKGLKFGMYSCAGMLTCAGYPSSYDHEFIDAQTFAEWGVDFLKYDYCFKPTSQSGDILYKRMGIALANSGRDILFSACSWGADETKKWINDTGAHMWRTTADITDSWESIKSLALIAKDSLASSNINCYGDMDMLVVGMKGKGNVGLAGCTDDEYRTHFAFWAFMGSPLMIGCDIRNMDEETVKTLTNKEIIAINQDDAYNRPFDINPDGRNKELLMYAKLLSDGDVAIGIFNFSDRKSFFRGENIRLDLLGLNESTGKTLLLKDVWTGEEHLVENGVFVPEVEQHNFKLYRGKVVDKK